MDNLEIEELTIFEDIKHNFGVYNLSDLEHEDDINEGLTEIKKVGEKYRHVHVKLRNDLANKYDASYPNYGKIYSELIDYTKNAKKRILELRNKAEKKKMVSDLENTVRKIHQLKDSCDVDLLCNVAEINEIVQRAESFVDYLYDTGLKFQNLDPDEYEKSHSSQIEHLIQELSEDVKIAKLLKVKLIQAEKSVSAQNSATHDESKRKSSVLKAENLNREIVLRCDSLKKKYTQELSSLTDYQILEISQNKNLDLEFNGVLEKVTDLASFVPEGGNAVEILLSAATTARDSVATQKSKFLDILQTILLDRDITPDKLKNASILQIELSKFSGYHGKIDYFTFKSQFKKLIEPTVQKKYWADYLKKNYLDGLPFTLVDKENDYETIWKRLEESYGDTRLLLQNKLGELEKMGGLWNVKGDEKVATALASLTNVMKELASLASEHGIEGQLYEGGGLEKVMSLIGYNHHRKFRAQNLKWNDDPSNAPELESKKDEWEKLLKYLKKELKLRERLVLDHKTSKLLGIRNRDKNDNPKNDPKGSKNGNGKTGDGGYHVSNEEGLLCHFCDKPEHTIVTTSKGYKIIPYYVCEEFVKMKPLQRLSKLKAKNLCTGCIFPGAKKGPKHKCYFVRYCCPHPSHADDEKLHVLLCDQHKKDEKNVSILEKFKDKFVKNCPVVLPEFSKKLSCFTNMTAIAENDKISNEFSNYKCDPVISESAIFPFQTIEVDGVKLNIFFDSGCGDMVVKKSAIEKLVGVGRAKQIIQGSIVITGVGDKKTVSDEGVYSICLPLYNGKNAILTGLCLPKITSEFPIYDLGTVENDIIKKCKNKGGHDLVKCLPKLPSKVGGDTDILLGIKYAKYFPKFVFECELGLGIFESCFLSPCGTRGVVGGPHPEFSKVEKNFKGLHVSGTAYFHDPVRDLRYLWQVSNDVPLLGVKDDPEMLEIDRPVCCAELTGKDLLIASEVEHSQCLEDQIGQEQVHAVKRTPKCVKQFDEIERAGTEVTYRCVDCRGCVKCKSGERIDAISIQEEIEQGMIERSVEVDLTKGVTTAKLPFVVDPDSRLAPNEHEAMKVYKGQARKLSLNPQDKLSVIESEKKLQNLGFVDFVSNLSAEEQDLILGDTVVRYFIPWRAVWNENSVSTTCRMVFDGSMGTKGGCSLNSLLAKGSNNMNNLTGIMIRWSTRPHAYHTDVTKMYNAVRLDKAHWRYQLYLWHDELDLNAKPVWKVIKTLIYGVRPSGNLAECGLRRTADLFKDDFPDVFDAVTYDTYVDDCVSGTLCYDETLRVTDELQMILAKAGFSLKGFSMSGEDPPSNLSDDGSSVLVGGLRWFPKGDFITLKNSELNFNKKVRGKKSRSGIGKIPTILTKRDCASKVSEIFDPLGKIAPLTGGMKIDISNLHQRHLDWDDPIPNELKSIWSENFEVMKEIGNLKFCRAVIPKDAVSLDVELIHSADAGENLICAAVHARYKLRNGNFSCQLIFARTKIVHDLTIPRAELEAALLNATTGHTVIKALKKWHKSSWYISDSQVALHWIHCTKIALKMWVRNRVIEISRLTDLNKWFYVRSENMIADIGTRKGAKISDVGPNSPWINGNPWMSENETKFPLKTINEVVLSNNEKSVANKEKIIVNPRECDCLTTRYVPIDVGERYKFSKYLINPAKFRFQTVIRILALVFLFIQKTTKRKKTFKFLKRCFNKDKCVFVVSPIDSKVAVIILPDSLLDAAKNYFYKKATLEVQHFVKPDKYEDISVLKDDILYYSGRILPTQEIDGRFSLGDACLDLSACSFCVPITDSHSPIAYAIVADTHWYDPDVNHGGIESVLRYSQNVAHIIGGRDLVKVIKKECMRCRILQKKRLKLAMGPVGEHNLRVAPPFYNCQVDLCGPLKAYSPANKRATLKIYLVVICCTVTSAVDIRVMEDYTADAFVLAFIRFACRFGYPKLVMPDEGSQLVAGCEGMVISISDIQHKLSIEYGVEFKTCPVGAHYVHGKVERKIQEVRKSLNKTIDKKRLSIIQWETLAHQIANSINNMPICLGNKTEMLESLDILTPNRLILGRNNNRCPSAPLELTNDFRRIIEENNEIFTAWFKEWLINYVPTLIEKPKWFKNDENVSVGDVVLFLKSDKEFERIYQYGIITSVIISRDGVIRVVEIEYKNHTENVKRTTKRGVREIIIIHSVDEIGIFKELNNLSTE